MLMKSTIGRITKRTSSILSHLNTYQTDQAETVCTEWLKRDADQRELAERWRKLEGFLIREYNFFKLSERERAVFVEADSLDLISGHLDELYKRNKKLLHKISMARATTAQGLSSKLRVALALVHPDENKDVCILLRSILHDIELKEFDGRCSPFMDS